MLRICLVISLFVLVAFANTRIPDPDQEKFDEFIVEFDKSYTPEEYAVRFEVFKKNLRIAEELDSRSDLSSYGVTKFMDLSPEEFRARYLLKDFKRRPRPASARFVAPSIHQSYPTEFDWNSKDVITPVYNQGQCGSCWAFSTTENIESMWALANNTLTKLSMQQIVSCDPFDGGCNGGNPPTAYDYVISAGGIESYADYPYIGINGQCHFDKSKVAAKISKWQWITQDDNEAAMQSFVYSTGPPSICVDAATWQYYNGGVITTRDGCGTSLDHCVQLTGWSQRQGMTVWNVRNSWGTTWGPYGGYLYIEKGGDVCGIGQEVTSSVI